MTGATNEGLILALNCGSSSIKFALFDMDCEPLSRTPTWRGKVDGIGSLQSVFDDGHGALLPLTLDA
ncbi:MAG: acetate kinase, partial [Dokdonella sp.]